ncbi:SMP-30/gluconolactonase/LRE family protein [Pararhizobium sp. LjRoot235]|uniref:SMP-30/gluconolactonase/LRE family protein n=1 Tax=Pararhizobium sp. LjRoot235 TaxID=3342291 RepID=UPI003ECFEB83
MWWSLFDVKGERTVFHDGRSRPGGIDGSVMDKNGYLWNARWGTGELDCIAPAG